MTTDFGLTLGGGGAKGFAHVGVLNTLKEAGLDFGIVTGTSIGSLVGAIYACGEIEKFEETIRALKLIDLPRLLDPTISSQGFLSGRAALELLGKHLNVQLIEELPKRYAAISADLLTATKTVSSSGNLLNAIRASIAVPGLFTPIVHENKLLVDGGILDPLPVQTAMDLGARLVVAVDLYGHIGQERTGNSSNARSAVARTTVLNQCLPASIDHLVNYMRQLPEKFPLLKSPLGKSPTGSTNDEGCSANILEIVIRSQQVIQHHLTRLQLQTALMRDTSVVIVLSPDVSDFGFLDFHRAEELIASGRNEAQRRLPEIIELINSASKSQETL